MSKESRDAKSQRKVGRSQGILEITRELNNVLRAKAIRKELERLGIKNEFDIENNTGYTLDIEIVDNLIIINEVEQTDEGTENVRTDEQGLEPHSCHCCELR